MTTPDPRPPKASASFKQLTALEALRAYIKEWSKIDASLKVYAKQDTR
jgi:hypothetical protein